MPKPQNKNIFRTPITMPEEMFDYLAKLSIKAKATGGKKLAVTEIVRAIVSTCLLESKMLILQELRVRRSWLRGLGKDAEKSESYRIY